MTPARLELLQTLAELSERFPEFRFGQMVVGLVWEARDFKSDAIYDIDDEELLSKARELLTRRPGGAPDDPTMPVPGQEMTPGTTPNDRTTSNP